MGTAVKRFATHVRRRLPGNAELEQHLAFGCAFSHHVPAVVCAVKDVVGVDVKACTRARTAFTSTHTRSLTAQTNAATWCENAQPKARCCSSSAFPGSRRRT